MINRILTQATHRIFELPILVMMPHSRCNCRCVMCDIWKANSNKQEISAEELNKHLAHFRKLRVREIVFSGGEALMHSNLWSLCKLLKQNNIKLTLLSTGLLLERNAQDIVTYFQQVIVSIDGSREVHDKIRNIPGAFDKLVSGVAAIRRLNPSVRITARCVLQRQNFEDYVATVKAAKDAGIDQISFLTADITTPAFNHVGLLPDEKISQVALTVEESERFERLLEDSFNLLEEEYRSGFIAERPEKIRSLARYYKALNGRDEFATTVCNAPWVSAVIESDGRVMPCFFHEAYGNIYDDDFMDIINSQKAIQFRKQLNVKTDAICKKCVCSLRLGILQ
jgi:Fe-coproporphyrin III synthase